MEETGKAGLRLDSNEFYTIERHSPARALWLVAGLLLCFLQGCATSPISPGNETAGRTSARDASQQEMPTLYRPSTDATSVPSMQDAEKIIRLVTGAGAYHDYFGISGLVLHASDTIFPVSRVRFESDAVVLELERAGAFQAAPSPVHLPYSSLKTVEVMEGHLVTRWIGLRLGPEVVLWHLPKGDKNGSMAQTKALADAMFSLYKFRVEKPALDAEFVEVARKYRTSNPKPITSEEVHRFSVIALSAVRERRFLDAAKAYDEGLRLAPWWPEGQFNAALMYGELRYYDEAIDHMKKYIALVPEAPNARAAQDKIYVWESRLTR